MYLAWAFPIVFLASMGHSMEVTVSKELTPSTLYPRQLIHEWLRAKIDTLIANDGEGVAEHIFRVTEAIKPARIMIDEINEKLETVKMAFDNVPMSEFKHSEKGRKHFHSWYAKGEAMRDKYTPCVRNFEVELEDCKRRESISEALFTHFQHLRDDLDAYVINDGNNGFFQSLLCTLSMTFRALWQTLTVPNVPVYDVVFYKSLNLALTTTVYKSCLRIDSPTSTELEEFIDQADSIVSEARKVA